MNKHQQVRSTPTDVFDRVAQCTLICRLPFEFVLMFDEEAITGFMAELDVMQQIEGKAPKMTRMRGTVSDISFDDMAQLLFEATKKSFMWLSSCMTTLSVAHNQSASCGRLVPHSTRRTSKAHNVGMM